MNDSLGTSNAAGKIALGFVLAWSISCGGSPPPPPAPPPGPPPPAPALVAAADITEAPEPAYVVGIVRWKSPQATLDTVNRWTGLPLPGPTVASQLVDKGLADALAYDAPVDGIVALDPKASDYAPFAVFSVGVRSLEQAKHAAQAMGSITEVRPGEYKVSLHRGRRKSDKPFCLLRASVGVAPARFVCGARERDVNALSGYMARTLPTRDLGTSDVHLELHVQPAVQLYGPMLTAAMRGGLIASRGKLAIGEPAFDHAADAAVSGISEELVTLARDLDTVTIDASIAPDKADATIAIRLKGQQSWSAGTLASQASRAGAPPPMFWRLPASATTASYQYEADAHRFDAMRHTLGDLLDGWLAHEGIGPADRAPFTTLFSDKLVSDTPIVSASGPYPVADKTAAAKKGAPAGDPLQASLDGAGWYMFGIGAPNQIPELFKSLSAGFSRPKVQSLLRGKLAELDSPRDAAEVVKPTTPFVTMKSTPAPKELRKGSLAFELTLARDLLPSSPPVVDATKPAKAKAPAKSPLKLHVLVVPEAAQTWVAIGGDRAELVKTVMASTEGAPQAGTIASRQDLDKLKNGKLVAGTFMTLESFLHSWIGVIASARREQDGARKLNEARTALNATPHHGKTPLFMTADIAQGDGLVYSLKVDVPKGYIEDAIVLIASATMSSLARP